MGVSFALFIALRIRWRLTQRLREHARRDVERWLEVFEESFFTSLAAEHTAISISFAHTLATSIAPLGQGGKHVQEVSWALTSYMLSTACETLADISCIVIVMSLI